MQYGEIRSPNLPVIVSQTMLSLGNLKKNSERIFCNLSIYKVSAVLCKIYLRPFDFFVLGLLLRV